MRKIKPPDPDEVVEARKERLRQRQARDDIIRHLKVICTWATFAERHNMEISDPREIAAIIRWTQETIKYLEEGGVNQVG